MTISYDIQEVLAQNRTRDQLLTWFHNNMPYYEDATVELLPAERVARDVIELTGMWGSGFGSMVMDSNTIEPVYLAQESLSLLPACEAKSAVDAAVAVIERFNLREIQRKTGESYYSLDDSKKSEFETAIGQVDTKYFSEGKLWGEWEQDLYRFAYQFVIDNSEELKSRN